MSAPTVETVPALTRVDKDLLDAVADGYAHVYPATGQVPRNVRVKRPGEPPKRDVTERFDRLAGLGLVVDGQVSAIRGARTAAITDAGTQARGPRRGRRATPCTG